MGRMSKLNRRQGGVTKEGGANFEKGEEPKPSMGFMFPGATNMNAQMEVVRRNQKEMEERQKAEEKFNPEKKN
eukprot:CAMPEP_0117758736 /NCGR_PEP_ID=MMETSP0947-20121206/15582_1 /TAXON_ID=44440 /ORGANISM="Chattonella subsalsa, Strain CCMP2191" /LENGTH=72 /DNA_ID=CAMNT_0005579033 /DNA_START=216 /DNA_END=434 /DNA_ORIENTATION=+